MNRKLSWVKEAFSREIVIRQDGQTVGGMHQNLLSSDVEAHLNALHLRFDVLGFIFHSVTIHDLDNANQIAGQLTFSFGKRAELTLPSGESYLWKRHNVLMREWDMIRETTDGESGKEVVSYELTHHFFRDSGDIVATADGEMPNADLIILTGLFVRNYFRRRRRIATLH